MNYSENGITIPKLYEIINIGDNGTSIVQMADDKEWYELADITKAGGTLNGKTISGLTSQARSGLQPIDSPKFKPGDEIGI